MSDRYMTLRSLAVMVSSLRMGHLSLVMPKRLQRVCRSLAQRASRMPHAIPLWSACFSRTKSQAASAPRASGLSPVNAWCRVAATSLACLSAAASATSAQSRPETPAEKPTQAPATSLLVPIVRDQSPASNDGPALAEDSPAENDSPAIAEQPGPRDSGVLSIELPEISFEETLSAFSTVRGWLDQGGVPSLDGTPLPQALVASVVIRTADGVVGQDTQVAANEDETATTLRRAATRAIARAINQLQGPADAMRRERLAENLATTRLSIELSTGIPVPVAKGVSAAELDQWLRPGLEGMLLHYDGISRARTPADMLTTGASASAVLVTLVAEVSGDPASALEPYENLADLGYQLSFFRVRHAAQTTATSPPLILHRGSVIAPAVRTTELAGLADRIAAHIRGRAWPGVERLGLRDDLDPVTGRFARGGASPLGQAIAAEALLRYADAPGVDPEESARARRSAEATLAALAVVEGDERAPWGDAPTASACLNALSLLDRAAIERSSELRGLRDRCLPVVDRAFVEGKGFDDMIPLPARGVVARALVGLASFEPWNREIHLQRANAAIRSAFRDTPDTQILGLMPDLAWADIELADQTGIEPASAGALRDLRTRLLDLQLTAADVADADRDLAGGFVLDTGGSPLPTWQSARPAALMATMLGDPSLTRGTLASGEIAPQLLRLSDALRFVRQLTAEERIAHMYAQPESAIGGVRVSLWDQDMPLTASALGLIAVTESLESLDAIGRRNADAARRD